MSQSAAPADLDYHAILAGAGPSAAAQARALLDLLVSGRAGSDDAAHAEVGRGRDHPVLAAAVAYCLGYELRAGGAAVEPDLLRLAALAHDLGVPEEAQAPLPPAVRGWLSDRRLFFDALPGSPFQLSAFASPAEQALYAAHLIASLPLPVAPNQPAAQAFAAHPLGRGQPLASIALVRAAGVRVEDYLYEAPRLSDVRGAGRLLDRVSRVDVPALFGAPFADPADAERAAAVRAWWAARCPMPPLEAPECLLRVDAGAVVALAPAVLAEVLPAAIEALYAEQTLTGAGVAVARRCDLLELQYGLEPTRFWRLEYEAAQADADLRLLVADERRFEAGLDPGGFPPGKGFGELVTAVDLLWQRRVDERATHPDWETPVYAQRCAACDRRGAVGRAADGGAALCPPCARKRAAGRDAGWPSPLRRAASLAAGAPDGLEADAPTLDGRSAAALPSCLQDMGAASNPAGYVGLVYAAADMVRETMERPRSPSDFRAYSSQLAAATMQALQAALDRHLTRPGDASGTLPFDILELDSGRAVVVVPGDRALGVAVALGRAFERQFPLPAEGDPWAAHRFRPSREAQRGSRAERVEPPAPTALTISAGVLVAPAAVPLPLLRDLAAQLLQSAQRARIEAERERADPHRGGYCDFLVLRDVAVRAARVADWRAGQVRREPRGGRELRLFGAPYTWPELQALLGAAAELRRVGWTPAEGLGLTEALAGGEAASSVSYLYYRTRAPEPVRAALERLDEAWRGRGADRPDVAPPWRVVPSADRRERRETILADLVAIHEFAGGEPAREARDAAR